MLDKINANCLQENHDRNDVGDAQADLVAASVDAELFLYQQEPSNRLQDQLDLYCGGKAQSNVLFSVNLGYTDVVQSCIICTIRVVFYLLGSILPKTVQHLHHKLPMSWYFYMMLYLMKKTSWNHGEFNLACCPDQGE